MLSLAGRGRPSLEDGRVSGACEALSRGGVAGAERAGGAAGVEGADDGPWGTSLHETSDPAVRTATVRSALRVTSPRYVGRAVTAWDSMTTARGIGV
jgi:hypothetical protein